MPDILYLHGFAQTSPQETAQLRALRAALPEFRTHAPVYHPNGDVRATRISSALESAISIIEKTAAQKMHLVGYSFGGWMCALLAEQRPDLVDRVLLLAPAIDNYERNYVLKPQAEWQMPSDFVDEVRRQPARPTVPRPTTLVHGALDTDNGGSAPWRIAAWAAAQPFAAVHLLEGVDHDLEPWISATPPFLPPFAQLVREALHAKS